jgi:hypothetical protein
MDVFGFVFATAFLVAAFAVFAILGRLMDTVAAGIGSTVAPTFVSGFRAWTSPVGELPGTEEADHPEDDGQDELDAGTGSNARRRPDPGRRVPVTGLARRSPR